MQKWDVVQELVHHCHAHQMQMPMQLVFLQEMTLCPPMMGSFLGHNLHVGVPLHLCFLGLGSNNTPGHKPLGLLIKDPVGQCITNVEGNANPSACSFPCAGPAPLMVEIKDRFPELEMKQGQDVRLNTVPKLVWSHLDGRMPSPVVHSAETEQCKEPDSVRSSNSIKQGVDCRLEPTGGRAPNRVLVLMVWL